LSPKYCLAATGYWLSGSPGWPARAIDRRAASGGDAPALHIHEAFPLPGALAGDRQVVPSIARLG
jgi:hypothetical protein